jgi:hypothetical protein
MGPLSAYDDVVAVIAAAMIGAALTLGPGTVSAAVECLTERGDRAAPAVAGRTGGPPGKALQRAGHRVFPLKMKCNPGRRRLQPSNVCGL